MRDRLLKLGFIISYHGLIGVLANARMTFINPLRYG